MDFHQRASVQGAASSMATIKRGGDVGALLTTLAHGCTLLRATSDGGLQSAHIWKSYFADTLMVSSALSTQEPMALLGDIRGNLFRMSLESEELSTPTAGLTTITPNGLSNFGGIRQIATFVAQPFDALCTYSSRTAIVDLRSNALVHGYILPSFLTAIGGQPVNSSTSEFAVATKEGAVLFYDIRQNRNEPTMVVSCQDHITSIASNVEDTIVLGAVSGRCYFMRSAMSNVVEQAIAATGSKRSAVLSVDAVGRQVAVGTSDGRSALLYADAPNKSRLFPSISRGDPDFFASSPASQVDTENGQATTPSTSSSSSASSCAAVSISNSHLWITESANLVQKTYIEVWALPT